MTAPQGTLGPQAVPAVQPGCYWTDVPFMTRVHRQRLGPGTYKARVRLVFGDKRTRSEHTTDWREFVVPEPPPAPTPAPPPSRLDFADAVAQAVIFGGAPPVVNIAEVSLAWRDTGSALHVEVSNANRSGDAVRDFTLSVADIRWYDPHTDRSLEAHEVHGNGPFQELQLLGGTTQIFANRPEVFPFLDADCNYQGRTMDSTLEQKRLVTRGIWEVTFAVNRRSVIKGGRKLWFEWREGQPPKPWLPPSHRVKAVTSAPEPPTTLGRGRQR